MRLTGAQVIVECLKEQGVDTVFGYPGGSVIPLYNVLYEAPFKHILTVHEQGAIHAADGYARASGKTGVCIATSGPGATNLVTGIATAYMDSVPLVAITGQVATKMLGRDSFQEVDIVTMTVPVTKYNYLVRSVEELAPTLRKAFAIASADRKGPVLIDVPSDVQNALVEFEPMAIDETAASCNQDLSDSLKEKIEEAALAISKAKKPVILLGGGVAKAEACQEVRAFAQKLGAPVVSTLMGLGCFPSSDRQFLGLTGMHGHKEGNLAVYKSDVLVAIGSRFSDRVTNDSKKYAPEKTVIHIDVDPAEINKNVTAEFPLLGPMASIVQALTEKVQSCDLTAWWTKIEEWRREFEQQPTTELTAPWVMKTLSDMTKQEDVVFVTDVGQHQMWAAQSLDVNEPRRFLSSGGFGTMGFGLPAALGAQVSRPECRVVSISGDAGFKMTGMELYTVRQNNLPLISIVIDNEALGMVRQWQQLFYQQRYSSTLLQPFDFGQFARVQGIESDCITSQSEFKEALTKALEERKPRLLWVKISRNDLVTPMTAPSSTLKDYVSVTE